MIFLNKLAFLGILLIYCGCSKFALCTTTPESLLLNYTNTVTNAITKLPSKLMCPNFYPLSRLLTATRLVNCTNTNVKTVFPENLVSYYITNQTGTTIAQAMSQTTKKLWDIYVPPDLNDMTIDARNWYLTGVSNAEKNLDSFAQITREINEARSINPTLKTQLSYLLPQIHDANENNKELVPTLESFVNRLYGWTRNFSWFDKLKIKGAVYFVNGKRDNKSYYLLNGGALWCKLRVDKYLKGISSNPIANALIHDLNKFEDQILIARDSLDDAAQEYVKGIKKLVNLVGDVGTNANEIQATVDKMKEEMDARKDGILETSATAVKSIKDKINSL